MERHLAGPGPQTLARTLQRSSPLRRDRTHTHIHSPGHTGSLRGQPKTCRAAHTHSLWVPHTPHPPCTASDPAPAGRAAPPTFPDGGDAGSAPRVALGGGGGHPEQQQQSLPQREPEPSRRAEDAGARCAGGGTSGRRRRHPAAPERQRQAAETEPAPGRRQNLAPGGGVKRLTPPHPSPPPLAAFSSFAGGP